jgi:hypothetical protein
MPPTVSGFGMSQSTILLILQKQKRWSGDLLAKGFNPGYVHPRTSMADLQSQTPGSPG